jgi:hypothetical protein
VEGLGTIKSGLVKLEQDELHKTTPVVEAAVDSNLKQDAPPAPASPLNPMDWNLKQGIIPVGIGAAGVWGVSNILEHMLHEGHLHAPDKGWKSKVLKPLMPVATRLAKYAPVANVVYGATNTIGAAANGYAWRAMAFGLYTLASAAMLPLAMFDNNNAMSLQKLKHQLEHATDGAAKQGLAQKIGDLAKQASGARRWVALGNAVIPIGLMLGLFTVTKVAQSTQDVHLEHTHGNSLREMLKGGDDAPPMLEALGKNFKTETKETAKNFVEMPGQLQKGGAAIAQGWKQVWNPDLVQKNEDGTTPNAWDRFNNPVMNSAAVPLSYALAGFGRVLSAVMAVGLLAIGQKDALTKGGVTAYDKAAGEALGTAVKASGKAPSKVAGVAMAAMGGLFLFGQFAGGISALFTKFTGWDPKLSAAYRFSSIPYIVSGLSAAARITPLGLGATDWAKFGAFIQGSSYFMNLANSQNKPPAAAASKATTPEPNPANANINPADAPPPLEDASALSLPKTPPKKA